MKCPIDNEPLVMTERSGVEIDYCPTCRGIWLDRGELDKILERSANKPQPDLSSLQGETSHGRHGDRHGGHGSSKSRRKNLLSELLDL